MDDTSQDYEVGYGKPPKEMRFAKGQSGNPRGRPKGTKNVATTFHEITRQLINVNENGRARTVTKLEAIMLQLTNKAVSGDMRAMKEFMQWNRIFEDAAEENPLENPDTQKNDLVMKHLIARIRAKSDDSEPGEIDETHDLKDEETCDDNEQV